MKIESMSSESVRWLHDTFSIDTSYKEGNFKSKMGVGHVNIVTLPKTPEPKVCWLDERRRGTLQLFNQRR